MGKVRTFLAVLLVPFIVATAIATFSLWPENRKHEAPASLGVSVPLVTGTVNATQSAPCPGDPSGAVCDTVTVDITEGPDSGQQATLPIQRSAGQPSLKVNDDVVLGRTTDATGLVTYYFSDFERKAPLKWLGLAFAAAVVLIGRWRGIGALVGLAFTWFVVTSFMLPAILEGESPLLVAVTGAALIVFVVLYVAHGLNVRTTIALIGTLLGLVLTGVLAGYSVDFASITGLASEDVTSVQTYASQISVEGLLLAGIVIGSLGVLNDVTVTQSSAVWEVHQADPTLGRRDLYRSGMRVGRDHVASTVYTLVLAYVGAALPLLVVFALVNRSWGDVVASDVVAEEVVRTIAGSIGLICAVPITTALAALVMGGRSNASPVTTAPVMAVPHMPAGTSSASAVVVDVDADPMASSSTIIGDVGESTGQINLAAYPPEPTKKRFGLGKSSHFDRKMGRREKKFWSEE